MPTTWPSAVIGCGHRDASWKRTHSLFKQSFRNCHPPAFFGLKSFVFEKSKNGLNVITLNHDLAVLDGTPVPIRCLMALPKDFNSASPPGTSQMTVASLPPRPLVSLRTRHTESSGLAECTESESDRTRPDSVEYTSRVFLGIYSSSSRDSISGRAIARIKSLIPTTPITSPASLVTRA